MSKFSHIIEQTAYNPCAKLLSLLSLATSPNNTKRIYTLYLTEPDRTLFGGMRAKKSLSVLELNECQMMKFSFFILLSLHISNQEGSARQ
ncbi:hypothetical protein [Shouchella patagoniensis]|uniref:hypothetical protein n=1 Tax=Shouchella patagoniensis TaxID=228576 RepID=UPI0014733335|nr:hypothetical protein [Shouchella patagoniensis]